MPTLDIRLVDSLLAECGIVDVARITAGEPADSDGQVVAERHVGGSPHAVAELVAVLHVINVCLYASTQADRGRINSDVLEQASERGGSIKSPLRPPQYLDPFEVTGIQIGGFRPRAQNRR